MYKMKSFYDSHLHVLGLGFNMNTVDLSQLQSTFEIPSINLNEQKGLIFGRGWHEESLLEKRAPHKSELNLLSAETPVIFLRVCGHVLVCNDKAMALAGITSDSTQVSGGTFNFNTGEFTEDAMGLIYNLIPKPSKNDIKLMFAAANDYLLSEGITSVASDDFSTIPVHYELVLSALKEAYEEGLMKIRLYEQVNLPTIELLQDFIDKGYLNKDFGGFRMGPLKLLADGSLGGRTAFMNEPYSDDLNNKGIKIFEDETLESLIYLADSNNMDVAIHAIGDGMIDLVINIIERVTKRTKRQNHRHSIIHAQLANNDQIFRMKQLGISAIVQPIFLNSDIAIVEDRIGTKRKNESYLFKTMMKQGIKTGFSTDAPVERVNPFENIFTSVTCKSIKNPELGVFNPNECFLLDDALSCYTDTNYWLSYDEDKNYNDFIVVDKDIHTIDVNIIKNIVVLETYIDGVIVYKNKGIE